MRNPFNPGSGVPPPYLAGRDSEIERFGKVLDSIEEEHVENVIVYGLRGTGKTVLLDEFNKMCIQRDFLPIKRLQFSDKYRDETEFEKAFKYDVRVSIETFSKRAVAKNRVKSAVSYVKPKKVGVPDVFYYEPSYKTSNDVPFENRLKDYLTKNWPVFENSGKKGVIFLYDEFHTVFDDKQNHQHVLSDFLGAINEVQKDGLKYFLVLCGLPNLQLNVKRARSYAERMFNLVQVGNLDSKAGHDAITKPLVNTGYSFENKLVDAICDQTEGYPYFLQFYGKEIISNAKSTAISLEEYDRVKSIIVKELDESFFDPRFELSSNDEERILCRMAQSKGCSVPFSFIVKKFNKTKGQVGRSLARLEQKGMVYNYKRGLYMFSLPMFRDYLLRKCT
jgi:hypothetical protein